MRYREAGVDVERADRLKDGLGRMVRSTWGDRVVPIAGGFAGVTRLPDGADGATLVAATMDGVGTKLHVALAAGRVGDAAADLVYHCANDLLVHGARPLAFLDYVAQARLDPGVVNAVVSGLARACGEVGAALLGGETAEMPDTYLAGVVDVAGCMIGSAAPGRVLDGTAVHAGDVVLGLASAGLHTNGFSLARRVLAASGLTLASRLPGGAGETIDDVLLAPHRWYGPSLAPQLDGGTIHALAHVTGGGIAGNLVRVLPEGACASVRAHAWPRPPVFCWLIEAGGIPEDDAREAFNLGIGMVVVCAAEAAASLARELECSGERAFVLGEIRAGERGVEWMES
jgi:phosphoribosylformylglycinamidine cyclo-ligase